MSSSGDSSERERDRVRKKKNKKKKKKVALRLRPVEDGWRIASEDDSSEVSRTEINRIYEEAYMR